MDYGLRTTDSVTDIAIELEFNHNHRQTQVVWFAERSGWLHRLSCSVTLVY